MDIIKLSDEQLKSKMMFWYRKAHKGIDGDNKSLEVYNQIIDEINRRKGI